MYEDTKDPRIGRVFVSSYMALFHSPAEIVRFVHEEGIEDLTMRYDAPDIDGYWIYGTIAECFLPGDGD